jgi:U4/U6.U5 tri-snRNP component SNU23
MSSFYNGHSDIQRRQFTVASNNAAVVQSLEQNIQEKTLVQARTQELQLTQDVNKVQVVQDTNSSGFYCECCARGFKDSTSYLDHINGRAHLKKSGFTNRVEKSSFEKVKARLEYLKKKKHELPMSLQEKIEKQKQQHEAEIKRRKLEKQAKKQQKLVQQELTMDEDQLEMAKMMGFAHFSSKK